MKLKSILGAAALILTAIPAFADDIMVHDAYARSASPSAMAGGAFMAIMNHSDTDDRLIEVRSDVAKRVELHTHIDAGDGVMQMRRVEDGFAIAAGETHMLQRGGDHVMFMGLNQSFVQGDMLPVTLVFENAGEVEIEIPVDLERQAEMGDMSHGDHSN
ncbi:copper chaperone PCu(A)C [Halocynthiibacter namhaensis]|uniref:copper chaperone PCu(A)C n=1 Tax=Halocynthiibacter namhaensis TaxID=1290553 RepID=UPI0005798D10|nr:copper chaperone PCu(A)C [Halocynthiibacter namhaensis]